MSGKRDQRNDLSFDLDGDGVVSPWEKHLCKLCLLGALVIAFGDKAISIF